MAGNRFDDIAAKSAQKTNNTLASELTDLSRLTAKELDKMLPTKGDKARFAELMAIVTDSTSSNKKIKTLKANIDKLGPVLIKTLKLIT